MLKAFEFFRFFKKNKIRYNSEDTTSFFFHHTTCESTCDTLASSAANQGDNTVSVAQDTTSYINCPANG